MQFKEAKTKNLDKKLDLTGYALINLSILVSKLFDEYLALDTINKDFPNIISKELVENTLSTLTIDFLIKNDYLSESNDTFLITQKTRDIFDTVLQFEIIL